MNVFVFETYLEYASPADGTVMRHVLKDIGEFTAHNILYQFTYDDLSPQQQEIIGSSEDPIAVRVANRLPARTQADMRKRMVVTPAQIRLALISSGLSLSVITNAFAAIEDPVEREKAQVLWEYATIVERNNPFVVSIGALLGKTEEEIDAIFALASTFN